MEINDCNLNIKKIRLDYTFKSVYNLIDIYYGRKFWQSVDHYSRNLISNLSQFYHLQCKYIIQSGTIGFLSLESRDNEVCILDSLSNKKNHKIQLSKIYKKDKTSIPIKILDIQKQESGNDC